MSNTEGKNGEYMCDLGETAVPVPRMTAGLIHRPQRGCWKASRTGALQRSCAWPTSRPYHMAVVFHLQYRPCSFFCARTSCSYHYLLYPQGLHHQRSETRMAKGRKVLGENGHERLPVAAGWFAQPRFLHEEAEQAENI